MKKNKVKIILCIFFIVIAAIIGFLVYLLFNKQDNSKIPDIQINTNDINLSIFESSNSDTSINEEKINLGDASVNIDGEDVNISIGSIPILRKNYIKLNEKYFLIEVLTSDKENQEVPLRTDEELSLSYDNCYFYGKKWYLYNNETKYVYLIEDNTNKNNLSLNPKITIEDNISYFEFDKMFNFGGGLSTDINHYKIKVDDFISYACNGQGIDFEKFSTIKEVSFSKEDEIFNIETEEDLNNDKKLDSISFKIYDNYDDYYKCGFALKINDSIFTRQCYGIQPVINFIDIDKTDNYKEILLVSLDSDDESYKFYEIYFYNGKEIKPVFSGYLNDFSLEMKNSINNIDLSYINGELIIPCTVQDTVQDWSINKKFKLDENHFLYEKKPVYYQNLEEQEVLALDDIILYNSMNSEDISDRMIYSGQNIKLLGTSLDYWFVVEIEGGTYYVQLNKYGEIYELNKYPFEVFTNINAVD